jgi:hypothetical protein
VRAPVALSGSGGPQRKTELELGLLRQATAAGRSLSLYKGGSSREGLDPLHRSIRDARASRNLLEATDAMVTTMSLGAIGPDVAALGGTEQSGQ